MKELQLAVLVLLGIALFGCGVVQADEVTAQSTLSASGEPASQIDPPCGDPNAITKADLVLQGLSAAADAYVGYPVVSTSLEALPADTENWLKARLGVHDGPSVCSTLCVVTPSGVDPEGNASFCLHEPDGRFTCRARVVETDKRFFQGGFEYASFTDLTVTQQGSAQVVCVGVKNWAHNTPRKMSMTIRY